MNKRKETIIELIKENDKDKLKDYVNKNGIMKPINPVTFNKGKNHDKNI